MARASSGMSTTAGICTVIAVLAWASPVTSGSVPAPTSADEIVFQAASAAMNQPQTPALSDADEGSTPRRIVQVEKTVLETWAAADDPPELDDEDEELDEYSEPASTDDDDHRADMPPGDPPAGPRKQIKILLRGDECRPESMKPLGAMMKPRPPSPPKPPAGPWREINLLLKSYDELIEFYEEQSRWPEKEATLKARIEICRKLAELRMLAEFDGPGAAMQEYYRFTNRPRRAIELDLHAIEKEHEGLARKQAELEGEIARLAGRRELIERKLDELSDRREQRLNELRAMHERQDADLEEEAGDDEDDDDDEAQAMPGPSRGGLAGISQHLRVVENALADDHLGGPRRARMERRQAGIAASLEMKGGGRQATAAGAEQIRGEAFNDGPNGRLECWIKLLLAQVDRHIRTAQAQVNQVSESEFVVQQDDCDQ